MSCNTYIWYTVYTLFTCKPFVDIWNSSTNIQKAGDLVIVYFSSSPLLYCLVARLAGCIELISNLSWVAFVGALVDQPIAPIEHYEAKGHSMRRPSVVNWRVSPSSACWGLGTLSPNWPNICGTWRLLNMILPSLGSGDAMWTSFDFCDTWGEPILGDAVFSSWSTKKITMCQE